MWESRVVLGDSPFQRTWKAHQRRQFLRFLWAEGSAWTLSELLPPCLFSERDCVDLGLFFVLLMCSRIQSEAVWAWSFCLLVCFVVTGFVKTNRCQFNYLFFHCIYSKFSVCSQYSFMPVLMFASCLLLLATNTSLGQVSRAIMYVILSFPNCVNTCSRMYFHIKGDDKV